MKTKRSAPARLPNIVLSEVGMEGSGKTRFWSTMPKPIHAITSDINTKTVIRDVLKLDEDAVIIHEYQMPALLFADDREEVKDEAESKWDDVVAYLKPMIKERSFSGSFVFDTATDIYDLRSLAEFGKKDQISPQERQNKMGRVNTAYKGIVAALRDTGAQVCLVHRAKDKWIDTVVQTNTGPEEGRKQLTGIFDLDREGFKKTGFITEVEIRLAFDPTREVKEGLDKKAATLMRFGMQINRCTRRPDVINNEYWGRVKKADGTRIAKASFPYLMTQVFPTTTIEQWEEA